MYCIAKNIDPKINREDIIDAYLIGNPIDIDGKPKKSRPILVKFKENKTRNFVYRNKRKLRSVGQDSSESNRIFINKNLCKESKALFRKANELKKEKNYRFIWTSYGKILLKKKKNDKTICIKCTNDLSLVI